MSYRNSGSQAGSSSINPSEVIIRHIMCKDYDSTTNSVKTSAFDTAKLKSEGVSVCIEKLLDNTTRIDVINQLTKGKFRHICDFKSLAGSVTGIKDDNYTSAFELNYSPLKDNNAHADIKFSPYVAGLTRADYKRYRKLLIDVFSI